MNCKRVLFLDVKDMVTIPSGKDMPEDITDFRLRKDRLDLLRDSGAYRVNIMEYAPVTESYLDIDMLKARLYIIGNFVMQYTSASVVCKLSETDLDEAFLRLADTVNENDYLKDKEDWAIIGNKELADRMETENIGWEELDAGYGTKDSGGQAE